MKNLVLFWIDIFVLVLTFYCASKGVLGEERMLDSFRLKVLAFLLICIILIYRYKTLTISQQETIGLYFTFVIVHFSTLFLVTFLEKRMMLSSNNFDLRIMVFNIPEVILLIFLVKQSFQFFFRK